MPQPLYEQEEEEKITYKAHIEDGHVHVNLSTSDEKTIVLMLRKGFSVYFDPEGKENKNLAVTYRIPRKGANKGASQGFNATQDIEDRPIGGLPVEAMISELPRQALFTKFDSEETVHLDLNNLGIAIEYTYVKDDEGNGKLSYSLKIATAELAAKGESLDNLGIGVVSNGRKADKEKKNNANASSFDSRQGRNQIGTRSGGFGNRLGRQGRRQGGLSNTNRANSRNTEEKPPKVTTLDFWFKCSK